MSEYSVKRFPLLAEFQRIVNMFCEFEAEVVSATVREAAKEYMPHMLVTAVLDGDEEVEVEIRVRKREQEETSDA